MFKLTELVQWLGLSEFEIFIQLLGTLVFTVLLALRIGGTADLANAATVAGGTAAAVPLMPLLSPFAAAPVAAAAGSAAAAAAAGAGAAVVPTLFGQPLDWYGVFAPLFAADVLNGYFAIIVGIRMYVAHDNKRKALHRLMWSTKFLVLAGVFKYLLCLKLSGTQNLDYSEVFAPVFVLLQLVAVRACKLSGN